ncbi:MAG TPA: CDP-diacylglycerol--serine O-phosphatidyltransferase [Gemmatimonadetes bacterium]|jgi:CDP-diacylglycerol--serine O-phosphatidyltransferase|nr:CDP-diacylglycerol--serine O-phosphatidyltransferase [Gemmatimonadota bacterium]
MRDQDNPTKKLRKGIIILPSAFTLANLFFGFYAIVATTRGDFLEAGWFVVWAAIIDLLDGRIARATRTGSKFGAELDSLVDAISFGVAPSFIVYTLYFSDGNWSWMLPFSYLMAVVVRLARFNIEQAGVQKKYFHGLPCPTAGIILATFYPFSQTLIFREYLQTMPWSRINAILLIVLSALMLSNIPYALVPQISFRSIKGILASLWMSLNILVAISMPSYYFFPALLGYTLWGLSRAVIHGLLERLPEKDPLLEILGNESEEVRTVDYGEFTAMRSQEESIHHQPTKRERER